MRLVSDQPEEEIRKRREELRKEQALAATKGHLRRLAANIMRVVRGAGASYDLGNQMAECLIALREYRELAGHGIPSYDLDQMLSLDVAYREYHPWITDEMLAARDDEDGTGDVEYAKDEIQRACLQIAASTLLDQKMQISRGESDLSSALRSWEDAAEKRRAYHRSLHAPTVRPRTKRKQGTSSSTKAKGQPT